MSEILIKNFKAPKDCKDCCRLGFSRCPTETSDSLIPSDSGRPIGCPIVELPSHGRLIDADILKETLMKSAYPEQREWYFAEACQFIDEAPTIVEAST